MCESPRAKKSIVRASCVRQDGQTKAGGNHCLSQRMITAGHLTGGFTISKYVLDGEGGLVDWTTGQPARNEQRAWLPGKCRTCDT